MHTTGMLYWFVTLYKENIYGQLYKCKTGFRCITTAGNNIIVYSNIN